MTLNTVNAEEVTNGDFSSNGALFTTWPGYRGGGSNPADIDAWAFVSGGGGNAGINGDGVDAGQTGNADDPFGPSNDSAASLYAFIQRTGNSLTQTITLSSHTQYDVSFLASRRASNGGATGQVTIADNTTTYYDSGSTNWSGSAFQLVTGQFNTGSTFDGPVVIILANTSPGGDNTVNYANVSVIEVPEPSSLGLLGLGGLCLLRSRRK